MKLVKKIDNFLPENDFTTNKGYIYQLYIKKY